MGMKMKTALQILGIVVAMLSSQAAEPLAKDDWSETVGGLRARLVFGEGHVFNGTRLPEVYLELHNASDVGNPMEFDFDAGKSIHFDLRGADSKPGPKPALTDADGFVFGPFHITIPHDGTLKFPVTWSGYGIPREGGTALGFQDAFWIIPVSDKSEYFLSAALEVPETPRNPDGAPRWHGTIKIPPVRVPAKK
jgi:hypothetical protein